ncbi:hypothetical protein O181_108540 [Austropuccinia psidii MF-1]|uniref:Uncharacterized protein n=1 Tax=Austropuccinia psidii MF-1 TaxID=1389203 RepID=A0A9Q3JWL9_9BASI|nr:hypothetical protein [Austropuccinia psidii MF-1]
MAHVRWHATVCLSTIATRHTQIVITVQDADDSHAKPFNVNSYACPGSQCFTHKILMPVQVPNNSKNCLCRGSLATAPTLPYVGAVTKRFTCKSLHLCRLPKIQTIAYGTACFQQFTQKYLHLYRFLILYTKNPEACTGSQQFRPFLMPGQPPDNSKNSLHNQD